MNEPEITKQREISLLRGEETAVVLDWDYPWDIGAPCPHVLSSGYRTFLIYRLRQPPAPGWDGRTVRVITGKDPDPIVVVQFEYCPEFRFGSYYNEDNIDVHPLAEHGLCDYEVHEIVHSKWLEELRQVDIRSESP